MKLKVNTSPIHNLIIFVVIVDMGLFTVLSVPVLYYSVYTTAFIAMGALGLFVNCITNKSISKTIKPYQNFVNFYLCVTAVFIMIMCIYSYAKYNQTFVDLFDCFRFYLYFFLATPLLYIFTKQNGYHRFLTILTYIVIGYLVLMMVRALIYNYTGFEICPKMYEYKRYLRLRIFFPSIFGCTLPFIVFKLATEKAKKVKLQFWIFYVITIIYLFSVDMTRMYYIAIFVTSLVVILFKKRPKNNQLLVWFLLAVGIGILIISGTFEKFLLSFSQNSEEMGASTLARSNAMNYFSLYTNKNPIFSMGFVNPTTEVYKDIFFGPDGTCMYDDIGIANMWYHYGILGILFVAPLFIRLIVIFIKVAFLSQSKNKLFLISLIAFIASTQATLSLYDGQRILSLTIIWAIFEYENKHCKAKKIEPKAPIKITNNNKNKKFLY